MPATQAGSMIPYQYGVEPSQEIPITGPTAQQIMAQPRPITSQADLAQSGIIQNTLASKINKRIKDAKFEEMQEAFLSLVRKGKASADIAYNGAPEAFQDPDIKQYLPDPNDVRWVNPQTGQFNFVDWSKQFHDDLTNYRKWKFQMGQEEAKTARQERRDAASMERAKMANEIAKERNRISWANTNIRGKEFRFAQNKEINDILQNAAKMGIAKEEFVQKLTTPRFDKWTNQPIPLTDKEATQAQKVLQAYDEALLGAENEARWVQPYSMPGIPFTYQPGSSQGPMVPTDQMPPPRETQPAPIPQPASAPVPSPTPLSTRSLKPLTSEAVGQAKNMFPNDKAAAMKWLQDQGYNINE